MIYEDDDVDEEQLQQMNIQVPEVVLELPSDSDSSRCGNSCYCPYHFTGHSYFGVLWLGWAKNPPCSHMKGGVEG
jgi:hypothetical protein